MTDLKKNILISGCTKGIGYAIAELFAQNGFNVAGCARSERDLIQMKKAFESRFQNAQFIFAVCDVSVPEQVKEFGKSVLTQWQHIDILVNNAGIFLPGQIATEEEGVLETLLATNITSAYHLTRAVIDNMTSRKSGFIVNISSVAGMQAYPNGGSYSISKFALTGFSKQLREEMKPYGIRVTTVFPGATLTDSWSGTDLPESRFIPSTAIAQSIWHIYQLPSQSVVEDIVIRPQLGDI